MSRLALRQGVSFSGIAGATDPDDVRTRGIIITPPCTVYHRKGRRTGETILSSELWRNPGYRADSRTNWPARRIAARIATDSRIVVQSGGVGVTHALNARDLAVLRRRSG